MNEQPLGMEALASAVNKLSMKLLVTEMALQEVIATFSLAQRTGIAERLRQKVDKVLSEYSPAMEADAAATLQLAAFLAAAGHAPQR